MKLPNGYGSVTKMSGNRRCPWRAKKTIGWNITEDGRQKQIVKTIGCYPTKQKALQALAEYNANPYSIDAGKATVAEIYKQWSEEKYTGISDSNIKAYKASWRVFEPIAEMRFADVRKSHLQGIIDNSGKNYPTLRKIKVLMSQLYKFAMENDIVSKDYSVFVDIQKHKEATQTKREVFTQSEIETIWDNIERNQYVEIVLMLIYSGVRISELLDLKKEDINLEEQYFDVIRSKTEAGIRRVPIADKVLELFKKWYHFNPESEYLLTTPDGKKFTYRNYYDTYWKPFMKEMNMHHRPHDTRHTTISLLATAKVSQTVIKMIVGHSGAMTLTEKTYTHLEVKTLLEAINKI